MNDRPARIVYINPVGQVGGGEQSLLLMAQAVGEACPGLERHVIVGTEGPLLDRIHGLGLDGRLLSLPPALLRLGDSGLSASGRLGLLAAMAAGSPATAVGLVAYLRRLRDALHELRPDLVHSNGMKSHLLAALAAPKETPVVWHIRDYLGERPLMRRLLKLVPRPVCVIANSQSVRAEVRRVLPGLRVEAVLNAIDARRFSPDSGEPFDLDRAAGLSAATPGTMRVGLVATYARWKGQDVFIRAAAAGGLRSGGPPVRYYVIGSPIYETSGSQFTEKELRRLAAEAGVADTLGFVPYQADVAKVYRALDVAVHASTRPEPFGLAIAEAMACGKAAVVAAAGGAVELFTDGQDGLGHAPGDAAGLSNAILRLVGDDDLRTRIGESARQTALERFSTARLGREIAGIYASCLPARPRLEDDARADSAHEALTVRADDATSGEG